MKLIKIILFGIILTFLYFKVSPRFDHIDSGVYFNYSNSFFEDQDLNLANQKEKRSLWKREKLILTPKLHSPEFHSYGGVVWWSGFLSFSQLFNRKEVSDHDLKAINKNKFPLTKDEVIKSLSLSYSTFYAGIICLLLLFKFSEKLKLKNKNIFLLISVMATSFYHYWISAPGNAEIIASTITFFIIYYALSISDDIKESEIISLFLLCLIAFYIKPDSVLYFMLPVIVLYSQSSSWKKKGKLTLKLGLISTFLFLPLVLNNKQQFGSLFYGYKTTITSHQNLIFDLLFAPLHGYVYTTPITVFSFFGILLLFLNKTSFPLSKSKSRFLKTICIIPILKLFLESWAHSTGHEFGTRHYIMETPALLVGIYSTYSYIKNRSKPFLFLFWSCMIICTAWTFFLDLVFLKTPWMESFGYYQKLLSSYLSHLPFFISQFLSTFQVSELRISMLPLFPFFLLTLYLFNKLSRKVLFSSIATIFFSSLWIISIINMNSPNFDLSTLKYKNYLIAEGPYIYMLYENGDALQERRIKLEKESFAKNSMQIKKYKEDYLQYKKEATKEIIENPFQLKL